MLPLFAFSEKFLNNSTFYEVSLFSSAANVAKIIIKEGRKHEEKEKN